MLSKVAYLLGRSDLNPYLISSAERVLPVLHIKYSAACNERFLQAAQVEPIGTQKFKARSCPCEPGARRNMGFYS